MREVFSHRSVIKLSETPQFEDLFNFCTFSENAVSNWAHCCNRFIQELVCLRTTLFSAVVVDIFRSLCDCGTGHAIILIVGEMFC